MKRLLSALALLLLPTVAFAWTGSPTGATPTILYTEPTTYTTGAPITDLSKTTIYWKIGSGAETAVTMPATKASGGGSVTNSSILVPIVPCQSGTRNVA